MQDASIFIFGEEVPKIYPRSPEYKLVSYKKIEEPCDIEKICVGDFYDYTLKMEHAYSEGARIHALLHSSLLKKYVGTAHYRRYFKFFDKLPDLDKIFKKHDAICQVFDIGWPSIEANYKACHNIEDLNLCIDIIKEKYPKYSESADFVMKHDFFIPCNIFILKKEMFCKWADFVYGVLFEFNQRMGFSTDLDVYNHVVNNMDKYVEGKGGLPNSSTAYQSRIHAFLMERLTTIFFKENIKNPYHEDIVLTETHFNFEKTYFCQYEKQDISDNN